MLIITTPPWKTGIRLVRCIRCLYPWKQFVGEHMGQGMFDGVTGRLKVALGAAAIAGLLLPVCALAQSIRVPWSDYAHDSQHTAISPVASQPLHRVIWQTSVDLSVPTNNTG